MADSRESSSDLHPIMHLNSLLKILRPLIELLMGGMHKKLGELLLTNCFLVIKTSNIARV